MAGIPFSAIDDLVLLTQEKLIKRGAFVDLQTDLQDHVAVREMWKGKRKVFEGGNDWRADVQMDHNHSAKAVALYATDGSAINNTMQKAVIQPRHMNANYIYDLREPDFQRGGVATSKYVQTKYVGMMVSFFELLEEYLWTKPVDSGDELQPYGMAYWITKSATEGFNGGNPAGFASGRGGLSSDDWPRWSNWTAPYTNVTDEDLVTKMSRAHRKTRFRSPVSHSQPDLGAMKNGIYTNDSVIGDLERLQRQNNTNLGSDITGGSSPLFKSTPFTYTPYLDDDSTNPIYMLDWKWLAIGVLAGWANNLGKPEPVAGKHNVRRVDMDVSLNMVCTNLRRQAVFSTGI